MKQFHTSPQVLELADAKKCGPQEPFPKVKQNVTNAKLTEVSCDHDAMKNPASPPLQMPVKDTADSLTLFISLNTNN